MKLRINGKDYKYIVGMAFMEKLGEKFKTDDISEILKEVEIEISDKMTLTQVKKLADFVGGKCEHDRGIKYDVAILNDVKPLDVESAINKINSCNADTKLVIVKSDAVRDLINKYKPIKNLRVKTSVQSANLDDNLLIIK